MQYPSQNRLPLKGSALVAVFWFLAVLSLAIIAAMKLVQHDVGVTTIESQAMAALLEAEKGVAIAASQEVESGDPILSSKKSEESGFTEGDDSQGYEAVVTSESKKFNINTILTNGDMRLLWSIFIEMGLELQDAEELSDCLIDWIDANDLTQNKGAELAYYEGKGRLNQPFNRPFYHLDEMALVKKMDLLEKSEPAWREWFTVWTDGRVNVNEAEPEILAQAAEISIEEARTVVEQIKGPDEERYTEDDVEFQSATEFADEVGLSDLEREIVLPRLGTNDQINRVESTGWSYGAKRKIVLVISGLKSQRPKILERSIEPVHE